MTEDHAPLAEAIRRLAVQQRWEPQTLYRPSCPEDRIALSELLASGEVARVVNPLTVFADELYDLRQAGEKRDDHARAAFVEEFLRQGDSFGAWVYFPWTCTLVRYPERHEHRALRTYRNRDLITVEEQLLLERARIAIFGLSVGSNVVDQLLQTGVGEAYLIADPDRLGPSNLNRLHATNASVGMTKIDVLARKVSEVDPYVEQVHLSSGYDEAADNALDAFQPDLILEEVDDLPTKARLRRYAHLTKTPLVMVSDIGENTRVDVERHDLGCVRPFNGRVDAKTYSRLLDGRISDDERRRLLIRLAGIRTLSSRLVGSAGRIGEDLAGMPQLGSTATSGAALASIAVRELLTVGKIRSGSYVHNPRRTLRLGRQATLKEALTAIRALHS